MMVLLYNLKDMCSALRLVDFHLAVDRGNVRRHRTLNMGANPEHSAAFLLQTKAIRKETGML